jgi:hypothetical protein
MDLVNAHGVFALDPNHITTPIRMAAFAHCANAREAREIAAETLETLKLSGHPLIRVGDFMEALAANNKRRKPK